MNKLRQTIVSAASVLCCLGLFSCDNDSFIQSTGQDGRPSAFKIENGETVGLFYQGARLSAMKKENGSSTQFTYGDKSLLRISFNPPNGVADGHGSIDFTEEAANKIRIERSGEPNLSMMQVEEMELDDRKRPVKITELGYFQMTEKGLEKIKDGEKQANFFYDPVTGLLSEIEISGYTIEQSPLTYRFSYENSPGTMSQVDFLPWFPVYWAYSNTYSLSLTDFQFLNFKNNLKEIKIDHPDKEPDVLSFQYTYNKNDYPVTASDNKDDANKIKIEY